MRLTLRIYRFRSHPRPDNAGTPSALAPLWSKKLERRKNLYLTGRSSLPERRFGAPVAKRLPRLRRLPRCPNRSAQVRRIGVRGSNLGRAITPPLDSNSAGAHPIAHGIEQTAACYGYLYHEGTAGLPQPWRGRISTRRTKTGQAWGSTSVNMRFQRITLGRVMLSGFWILGCMIRASSYLVTLTQRFRRSGPTSQSYCCALKR